MCGAVMLLAGCSQDVPTHMGEDMRTGPYTLRVVSVDGYSRAHQGVPYEVTIRVECDGGNRFERMDFTEALSRRRRILFTTAQGYREHGWMLAKGDDFHEFTIYVYPAAESSGMKLAFQMSAPGAFTRRRFVVDLAR